MVDLCPNIKNAKIPETCEKVIVFPCKHEHYDTTEYTPDMTLNRLDIGEIEEVLGKIAILVN